MALGGTEMANGDVSEVHSQGTKRRLTPQQMELEKLQHEARQGMQKQLQVEGSIRAMPVEAVVAVKAVNEAALAPHMPAMLAELSVDLPVGARRAHLSTCHGALLMGGVEHFVSTAGQRVCPDCQALCRDGGGGGRGQLVVERQRVRLLMSPVGVWSKARDFYTRWEVRHRGVWRVTGAGVVCEWGGGWEAGVRAAGCARREGGGGGISTVAGAQAWHGLGPIHSWLSPLAMRHVLSHCI